MSEEQTLAEIPYWWHETTHIWVVILIGWKQKCALTNQNYHLDLDSDASAV